ncbi:hypothetical protein JKY79_01810 [Candidatus Babeliales bacterium]|nr:hypothetical protein [Candidatus Babeliales bacterium]
MIKKYLIMIFMVMVSSVYAAVEIIDLSEDEDSCIVKERFSIDYNLLAALKDMRAEEKFPAKSTDGALVKKLFADAAGPFSDTMSLDKLLIFLSEIAPLSSCAEEVKEDFIEKVASIRRDLCEMERAEIEKIKKANDEASVVQRKEALVTRISKSSITEEKSTQLLRDLEECTDLTSVMTFRKKFNFEVKKADLASRVIRDFIGFSQDLSPSLDTCKDKESLHDFEKNLNELSSNPDGNSQPVASPEPEKDPLPLTYFSKEGEGLKDTDGNGYEEGAGVFAEVEQDSSDATREELLDLLVVG